MTGVSTVCIHPALLLVAIVIAMKDEDCIDSVPRQRVRPAHDAEVRRGRVFSVLLLVLPIQSDGMSGSPTLFARGERN